MALLSVLAIPGLDGNPDLVRAAAPDLFPGVPTTIYTHAYDRAEDGLEGMAERALAASDHAGGVGPTLVCGESFGGAVALTLARLRPDRVRGLVLLSTFGWYPSLSSAFGRFGLAAWRVLGDRVADTVLRAARPIGAPAALGRQCSPELRQAFLGLNIPDLLAYRAKCRLAVTFDARPWLPYLEVPAFVLTGTYDTVVPPSAGRDLARRIPNARHHVLGGGHLVHFVRAPEVGRLIRRWLHQQAHPLTGHPLAA
jgi:poly(3-hydroxyoctanoate) depolymerase